MHWFWRATIAIVAGSVLSFPLTVFLCKAILSSLNNTQEIAAFILPAQVLSFSIYGILTRSVGPGSATLDKETRCRKCGYILRGITEPRCSECGERI